MHVATERIRVDLAARGYEILIETGSLGRAGEHLAPHVDGGTALVVADDQVAGLYGDALLASLRSAGIRCELACFPAGEPAPRPGSTAPAA